MRISRTRCTCPEDSPLRQSERRERLKYQASPVAIVRCRASAFMCATISTSPEPASVATQVTSPSASNFGHNVRPSSTSCVGPGAGKNGFDNRTSLDVMPGLVPGIHVLFAAPQAWMLGTRPAMTAWLHLHQLEHALASSARALYIMGQ